MSNIDDLARLHGAVQPRYGEIHIRNRGPPSSLGERRRSLFHYLPHGRPAPRSVLAKIAQRRRILESAEQNDARLHPEQKVFLNEFSRSRIEDYFDRGAGSCAFNDGRIARAMVAALRFREGQQYRLLAWCVMPNHVHVVVRLFPGRELAKIVKAWKNFTARAANLALGTKGQFWQREYYDRLIRDADELDRAIRYVLQNPAKAKLSAWPWVWSAEAPAPL